MSGARNGKRSGASDRPPQRAQSDPEPPKARSHSFEDGEVPQSAADLDLFRTLKLSAASPVREKPGEVSSAPPDLQGAGVAGAHDGKAQPRRATSPHAGHRERLRSRLKAGGPNALPDYELLELVLYGAIPRADTKPLAKALIARFGSFGAVINAPSNLLSEVKGVGDRVIDEFRMLRAAALRMTREEIIAQPVLSSWSAVLDYCRTAMAHADKEQFRILFLDKKNRLIIDEQQQEGTVDHTPVYIREVVKRALEVSATAIILVHNHPSGDPTPSHADVDMTKKIVAAAKPLGITVHDHLIIGRDGHASFKSLGLI